MPDSHEILILLVAIFAIWFVLKLAKLAIRVILFIIAAALLVGGFWLFFAR
jgi:hypothetical protein